MSIRSYTCSYGGMQNSQFRSKIKDLEQQAGKKGLKTDGDLVHFQKAPGPVIVCCAQLNKSKWWAHNKRNKEHELSLFSVP